MISFDLECANGHRFEGIFKDYESFSTQMERQFVSCPLCESSEVKRLYTGCSIQPKSSTEPHPAGGRPNIFEMMRMIEQYVKENFENVGREFPDVARAIYYGIEEARNIYGESSMEEMKELLEEGIRVLPLPPVEKLGN